MAGYGDGISLKENRSELWREAHRLLQLLVAGPPPEAADSVPVEVEDHYYLTKLPWKRLDGGAILGEARRYGRRGVPAP